MSSEKKKKSTKALIVLQICHPRNDKWPTHMTKGFYINAGGVCIGESFRNTNMTDQDYELFRKMLRESKNVAILSGAGLSAESGVPVSVVFARSQSKSLRPTHDHDKSCDNF